MTKSEFINYLLKTPANTNPNVVSTMLDQYGEGGSSDSVIKILDFVNGSSEDEWTICDGEDHSIVYNIDDIVSFYENGKFMIGREIIDGEYWHYFLNRCYIAQEEGENTVFFFQRVEIDEYSAANFVTGIVFVLEGDTISKFSMKDKYSNISFYIDPYTAPKSARFNLTYYDIVEGVNYGWASMCAIDRDNPERPFYLSECVSEDHITFASMPYVDGNNVKIDFLTSGTWDDSCDQFYQSTKTII